MIDQFETLSSSRSDHIYYTLFPQVNSAAVPFTRHRKLCNYAERKPISWAKPAHFVFSSSTLTVEDHILSTVGDAVITLPSWVFPPLRMECLLGQAFHFFWNTPQCFLCCFFPVIPDRDPLGITGCLKN
jgi:hypothetical protein